MRSIGSSYGSSLFFFFFTKPRQLKLSTIFQSLVHLCSSLHYQYYHVDLQNLQMCTLYVLHTFGYISSLEILRPFSERGEQRSNPKQLHVARGVTVGSIAFSRVLARVPGGHVPQPSATLDSPLVQRYATRLTSYRQIFVTITPCSCSSVWQLATRSRDTADTVLSPSQGGGWEREAKCSHPPSRVCQKGKGTASENSTRLSPFDLIGGFETNGAGRLRRLKCRFGHARRLRSWKLVNGPRETIDPTPSDFVYFSRFLLFFFFSAFSLFSFPFFSFFYFFVLFQNESAS